MATLANNHLSKHGRFGDTEMYKTSPSGPGKGKLWHVNPQEKTLMNMHGSEGERLVDAVGSGTINPVTGKEEKFVFTMAALTAGAAIGSLALGAYSSWKSGSIQEQTAKSTSSAADEGLEAIKRSKKSLMDKTQAGRQLLSETANIQWDELAHTSGVKKGTLIKESAKVSGKQNLYKSGATEEAESESMEELAFDTSSAQGKIQSEYGGGLGSLAGEHVTEMERLKSEEERLTREKSLAEDQSNSWFLGKHIGKTLQSIIPGGQQGYLS